MAALHEITREQHLGCDPHEVNVFRANGELTVSLHCALAAETTLTDAHELSERIEHELRRRFPHLGRVTIHAEPHEPAEHPAG